MFWLLVLAIVAVPFVLSLLLDNNGEKAINEYCILECAGYQAYPRKSGYNGYMY